MTWFLPTRSGAPRQWPNPPRIHPLTAAIRFTLYWQRRR